MNHAQVGSRKSSSTVHALQRPHVDLIFVQQTAFLTEERVAGSASHCPGGLSKRLGSPAEQLEFTAAQRHSAACGAAGVLA